MLIHIHPKLPMRDKETTRDYYIGLLGFQELGNPNYPTYLMLKKDEIEIHFFLHRDLDPNDNYGQVYIRTDQVKALHQLFIDRNVEIHPHGPLEVKPWGQIEFSLLDPDNNLLTFAQGI